MVPGRIHHQSFQRLFVQLPLLLYQGSKYGTHMEEKISVKTNAIPLKNNWTAAPRERNTDTLSLRLQPSYLQIEKYQLTRKILELFWSILPTTHYYKSPGVIRDIDLLHEIDKKAFVPEDLQSKNKHGFFISFSINDEWWGGKDIWAWCTCTFLTHKSNWTVVERGILDRWVWCPCCHIFPYRRAFILFQTFADIGVKYVLPAAITLPGSGEADAKTLYLEAVRKNFPELLEVSSFVRVDLKCRHITKHFDTRQMNWQKSLDCEPPFWQRPESSAIHLPLHNSNYRQSIAFEPSMLIPLIILFRPAVTRMRNQVHLHPYPDTIPRAYPKEYAQEDLGCGRRWLRAGSPPSPSPSGKPSFSCTGDWLYAVHGRLQLFPDMAFYTHNPDSTNMSVFWPAWWWHKRDSSLCPSWPISGPKQQIQYYRLALFIYPRIPTDLVV